MGKRIADFDQRVEFVTPTTEIAINGEAVEVINCTISGPDGKPLSFSGLPVVKIPAEEA
jgi:hypothetical protein